MLFCCVMLARRPALKLAVIYILSCYIFEEGNVLIKKTTKSEIAPHPQKKQRQTCKTHTGYFWTLWDLSFSCSWQSKWFRALFVDVMFHNACAPNSQLLPLLKTSESGTY